MKAVAFYSNEDKYCYEHSLMKDGVSGTLFSTLQVCIGLRDLGYKVYIIGSYLKDESINGINYCSRSKIYSLPGFVKDNDIKDFIYVSTISVFTDERLPCDKVYYWCHNWIDMKSYAKAVNNGTLDGYIFVSYYHFMITLINSIKKRESLTGFLKSKVMHNSLDFGLITSSKEKGNIENIDQINLAFVGYPSINKGILEALNIASEIARCKTVVFSIFGGKDLYSHNGAVEADLSQYSNFEIVERGTLGRDELYDEIRKQDLLLAGLSGSETFCVSVAESVSLNTPVITSYIGGQNEIITGKSAILVYEKDINSSHKIITQLSKIKKSLALDKTRLRKHFSRNIISLRWQYFLEDKYYFPRFRYLFKSVTVIMKIFFRKIVKRS